MRELFGEYGIISLVMIVTVICLLYFMKIFMSADAAFAGIIVEDILGLI